MSRRVSLRLAAPIAAGLGLYAFVAASSPAPAAKVRHYYISADEVAWDYVPGARNGITGEAFQDSAFFVPIPNAPKPGPVSSSYRKVLYREYTDSTFATLKPRVREREHLGSLGPLIRGEVGDTIRIVFRNAADRPYSMHPHGVFYNKDSEGAPYDDGTGTADKHDDGVPAGEKHVYVWPVPERAGPGRMEGSSVMWMYHSHTDETKDVNTGLIGVMLVTARGKARPDGSPTDVDREVVAAFMQTHEEDSWLAAKNLPPYPRGGPQRPIPNASQVQNFYPYFVTFSINGFSHGGMPLASVTLKKGQRVRWYLMSSTNDFDFHTPHWHGNTVEIHGHRMDVTGLMAMEMQTADMTPDNPGTWLFHCHVTFHNAAGMAARYRVE